MYTYFTLRFGSLSSDQSTVVLIRLCCQPSVYEVIQNEQYEIVKCCQYYLDFNLQSKMLAKLTDKFEFKNNMYIW